MYAIYHSKSGMRLTKMPLRSLADAVVKLDELSQMFSKYSLEIADPVEMEFRKTTSKTAAAKQPQLELVK